MGRPICVNCKQEYQCKKNDQVVNDKAVAGGVFPETFWLGDLWQCPACKHQVVTGRGKSVGLSPLEVKELGGSIEFGHC